MTSGSRTGMRNRLTSTSSPSLRNTPSVADGSSRNKSNSPADNANSTDTNNNNNSSGSSPTLAGSPVSRADSSSAGGDDDTGSNALRRTSSAAKPTRPGLFSRLSLPLHLRGRNRHVADFHIQTAEPHRKYHAGEHVRGSVFITVVKPFRLTHLTVALSGFVQSRKEPGVTTTSHPNPPSGHVESPQYHGNGLATLFQDEQVLSGEGRLDVGKFEFKFDLLFPSQVLPSSIDFERGAICYTITATLTRPTPIAATTTCDRTVKLVETIDIGRLPPPRPRTIFLEPISKRTRRRKSTVLDKSSSAAAAAATAAAAASSDVNDYMSEAGSADPSVVTDDSGRDRVVETRTVDQSDIRSEISGESGRSVSTGGLSRAELAQVASARQQVVDDKTIVATVEMLRGGCLPGDTVTVRVTVHHIKRVKSINGVIVTLFRQGKIDSSPSGSLFTDSMTEKERKRLENNGVLPKSRTGLAGLSLSSNSSTSIFRKDLDQTTAPLIIHPTTMGATVTVSVRIPNNAFTTIKNIPGDMISFRYQVEVIVDLGGRLSNKFQGGQSRVDRQMNGGFETSHSTYNSRGSSIADTGPLRREKGVIAVTMEITVGSEDSSRGRAGNRASQSLRQLRTATQSDDDEAYHTEHSQTDESHMATPYTPYTPYANDHPLNGYFRPQHAHPNGQSPRYSGPPPMLPPPPSQSHHYPQTPSHAGPSQTYPYRTNGDIPEATPEYIPPPEARDERNMTDKERIRQAEIRLLPSQPSAPEATSSTAGSAAASSSTAPVEGADNRNDETNPTNDGNNLGDDPPYDEDATPRGVHASPILNNIHFDEAGPSAPPLEEVEAQTNPDPSQDKQEVERQRLMGEASAPPEVPDDSLPVRSAPSNGEGSQQAEPSAPTLTEDDEYFGYGAGAGPSRPPQHHHNEQLPAYER